MMENGNIAKQLEQIANELAIMSKITKSNNVSFLAGKLGYRPAMIIVALQIGEDAGLFKYNKKKDLIKVADDKFDDLYKLDVTNNSAEIRDLIERLITIQNTREVDLSTDEIAMLMGFPTEVELLNLPISTSDKLSTYELSSGKDKKSVYTFVTLKENVDKQWGAKQFKS